MSRIPSLVVLSLLFSVFAAPASAQPTEGDTASYQRLRERLRTRFLVVGEAPGQSMPAHIRNDDEGYIRWADATIDLGWYIGVLATEHYLAESIPGADMARTRAELASALAAMERLDRSADAFFPAPCSNTPALNGFFLRDDIPAGFHGSFSGLSQTRSDSLEPEPNFNEMSQDQAYHVLLGLALVKALVPADVEVDGRRLNAAAVAQATRILRHIAARPDWVIRNPACGDRPVARGDAAGAYSRGTAAIANFLTDGAFVPEENILGTLWNLGRDPDAAFYRDVDNLHMIMAIAAVGGGWGDETLDVLVDLAAPQGWHVYPLLHRVVHGDAGSPRWCALGAATGEAAAAMLGELPLGDEPRSPRPGGPAAHSFTTSNRFIRPAALAYVGRDDSAGHQFHGLDFMLLHNLLAIALEAPVPECGDPVTPPTDSGPGGSSDGGDGADAAAADGGGAGGGAPTVEMSGGCAVSAGRPLNAPWAAVVVLAGAVLALRRRRR